MHMKDCTLIGEFKVIEAHNEIMKILPKDKVLIAYKEMPWYCHLKLAHSFIIKYINALDKNAVMNIVYDVLHNSYYNIFLCSLNLYKISDYVEFTLDKEKKIRPEYIIDISSDSKRGGLAEFSYKITYNTKTGIVITIKRETSIYKLIGSRDQTKYIKDFYSSIKDVCNVEISLNESDSVVSINLYEYEDVKNVWKFLSKFKTPDDLVIYTLDKYPEAREKYFTYYDNLLWKKYTRKKEKGILSKLKRVFKK